MTKSMVWTFAAVGALLLASTVGPVSAQAGSAGSGHEAAHAVSYQAAATFTLPPKKGSILEPQSAHPLALKHGYVEREYFAAGRASAFTATSLPKSGRWSITRTTAASYRTRVLVRRPPKSRFNGTVIVEWMNVTEAESSPDWDYLNPMLMRDGYAYVAVSDQALGVNGGTSLFGEKSPGLVGSEPARYKSLHHPGDKYSLDMFAQIGTALHNPKTAAQVLGGLQPKHIVATGESQSAYFLTTFADAIQPKTHAYDGIFIHSRGGGAAGFTGAVTSGANNIRIRTDLPIPVFMFETQTDLVALDYAPAQQPNTSMIRTWEVAGTAHADSWIVGPYAATLGCTTQVNNGPQHLVVQAAFTAFGNWVTRGTKPAQPGGFQLTAAKPPALVLAPDGNVRGGVRTPAVSVPISTLSGAGPAGASEVCSLFGSTTPFSKATLAKRYGTPAHYLADYKASLTTAIDHRFVLKADRAALIARARKVTF
jgi:Alpha/beta hydrolase domain